MYLFHINTAFTLFRSGQLHELQTQSTKQISGIVTKLQNMKHTARVGNMAGGHKD